jgi:hypothetical protein
VESVKIVRICRICGIVVNIIKACSIKANIRIVHCKQHVISSRMRNMAYRKYNQSNHKTINTDIAME